MIRLASRALVLGGLAVALQGTSLAAHAAVSDIQSSLLRSGEALPGFGTPHSHLYQKFHSQMDVSVSHGGITRLSSVCVVPTTFAAQWAQGVIESFDTTAPPSHLQILTLCAYRFTTAVAAQSGYKVLARGLYVLLRNKSVSALRGQAMGDQSYGVGSNRSPYSDSLVFRHANAVVQISYLGPQRISARQFLRLGGISNSRLR
ncbi:MAG TPA: hypothetical protein VF898_07185 [Chloroflexota bacterium]